MAKTKYFDRYVRFKNNGDFRIVPFIKIERYDTDLFITYDYCYLRFCWCLS